MAKNSGGGNSGSSGGGFPFMTRPARMQKPRTRGMTVALDWGRSISDAESYVETVGDVVDHMKLTDHIGLMFRYTPDYIKRKNAVYGKAGIDTLPGGVVFEMAAVQGKVPELMARTRELGFGAVEVSADCIDFPPAYRRAAIKMGVDHGLKVFTEIGKKSPDKPLDVKEAVETSLSDIDAGAEMVVVEKSDVELVMRDATDTLHRVIEAIGHDKVIIECGPGDNRFQVAGWLIKEFGMNVNLENVDAHEVFAIEAMRHGFHRAVGFSYFHEFAGKALPPLKAVGK
jgi:phosphosulfolactate synthase